MSPPPNVHDLVALPGADSGAQGHAAAPSVRRTLPPPEWLGTEGPRSAGSVALERFELEPPVARRSGPRAELATLRARLAAAQKEADSAAERGAAMALARALATRGTELELATKLARRALLLGDDPVLREELASWFATLGESALAAATLQPLAAALRGRERGTLLVREAVLFARAGEARAALEALDQSMAAHPEDPVGPELLASLAAWSPETVSAEQAAEAFVFASERRAALGDRAAAFENLIRAFEVAPAYAAALEKLHAALLERGRHGAADEALREHGRALGPAGRSVHLRRLRVALEQGDVARALGAAFDARLDADRDVPGVLRVLEGSSDGNSSGFDALLERAGLDELLAARAELACDGLSGQELSRAKLGLGKLYAKLGRTERALEAWSDAVASDLTNEGAKECLRRYGEATRDDAPLAEALLRALDSDGESSAELERARQVAAQELAELAETRLGAPALARWARQRAGLDAGLPSSRLEEEERTLAELRSELGEASGERRLELLRRSAELLWARPDAQHEYAAVLKELCAEAPDDRSARLAFERLLLRQSELEKLEALWSDVLQRAETGALERVRVRLALATLRRRRGDTRSALEVLVPLLDEPGAHAAWSATLLLAAELVEEATRARALLLLAGSLPPALRATLTAVAAEWLLAAGELERARRAADQACHADPSSPRPVATRARVGLVTRDRWGADAMERAMGVTVPGAAMCGALAEAYDAIGEPLLANAWVQRQVALRPGDLGAARTRLSRALDGSDGARLADTLAWLLSQPQPLTSLAELIAQALGKLAELAPGRASALARRALDVLGARNDTLREAVIGVADKLGERGLGIAALERWVATGSFDGNRGELLLELARRRREAGDADGAARALTRAIREGALPERVLAELDAAPPPKTSDGELSLLEARAETLSALPAAENQQVAAAWRTLGAARWDLSADRDGALGAWERAASLDPERGIERLAADMVAFFGVDAALERLRELSRKKREPDESARVLAVTAALALEAGRRAEAFETALGALTFDPSRTDVLAVAERAASDSDVEALERLYDGLAKASLGTYGERAVHYRAARQLERHGALDRALRHAVLAFEAVPSEGVVFVTMARLADRAGERAEVVRAIERVALANASPDARATWLRRAALFTGASEEGRRQRVDVLLRALSVRAEADLVRALAKAMEELMADVPDEREVLELRFERAVEELLRKVDGPEGARIALEVASIAARSFQSPDLALLALGRALSSDGDVEGYAAFGELSALLAQAREAKKFVERVVGLSRAPFSNLGAELLELGARLAEALGNREAQAWLLVQAACKRPEELELVRRAESLAKRSGDPKLIEQVLGAVPPRDRVRGLIELAVAAEAAGERERAAEALERALSLEDVALNERVELVERALEFFTKARDDARIERLGASSVVRRGELPEKLFHKLVTELSRIARARGDARRVFELWVDAAGRLPGSVAVLSELERAAEQAGEIEVRRRALERLIELEPDSDARLGRLRALARALEAEGEASAALDAWRRVLELDAGDEAALEALERDAERRRDHEALAEVLAKRAVVATLVDDVRRIRLRRAAILDQELGRPDDARSELEALLFATGDHGEVLEVLADLWERLGSPSRAAPLWLRASALAAERARAAELTTRACQAYLASGDVEGARRVLEGMEAWVARRAFLELALQIERRRAEPRALADVLEELASDPEAAPEERARWLLEAARASLAAGDETSARKSAARAVELGPSLAEAQLFARWLEYLERGAGTQEQAREAVVALGALGDELTPDDLELRAFLLAEALDAAGNDISTSRREIERALASLGLRPLLALAAAERLPPATHAERALEAFDVALSGDLRRVRRPARVALRAAEVARSAGQRDRAEIYCEFALGDPETRDEAEALREELRRERQAEQGASLSGVEPVSGAEALAYAASGASAQSPSRTLEPDAGRYSFREPGYSGEERIEAPNLAWPNDAGVGRETRVSGRYSLRPEIVERASLPVTAPPGGGAAEAYEHAPASPHSPVATGGHAERDLASTFVALGSDEEALHEALRNGSVDAGLTLMARLKERSDRAHDLVSVCRRVAALEPGNVEFLRELYAAAERDRDPVYVAALEHVLKLAEPAAGPPPEAPPLAELPEQPDAVRTMLFRELSSPVFEALSLVWEGAEHVFRRDPSAYGLTGMERVPPSAPLPIARVYAAAARALGLGRIPLFLRRGPGTITVNLALLSPPALVVSGEVREESPELRFHVGAMLAAALPQFALLFGAPESQARSLLRGLIFAFGPPRPTPTSLGPVLSLAELLWESVPGRLQRRLRELCDNLDEFDYETAMTQARVAVRRAGLYVSGDYHVAFREIALDEGLEPGRVVTPGGFSELCAKSPSLASLYRLAISPEYAETRWRGGRRP